MWDNGSPTERLNYQADCIERTLAAKKLAGCRVIGGTLGHRLAVFELVKPAGVDLGAVQRQEEELALALGAMSCRVARRNGAITVEVPRRDAQPVSLLPLLARAPRRPATAPIGVDESDTPLLLPLSSPNVAHVLICGTTGSGKTELARSMVAGLARRTPVRELGLILIDPKRRGYGPFAGLPHLVHEIIHEPGAAAGALAWAVAEMERRDRVGTHVPRLAIFIDELADLTLVAGDDVEHSLTRLVQRGREAGVHVVACTQKPTASVIGSLVKANFPCRIVGRVTDTNDAYVAAGISGTGAERLLSQGDFLVVAGGRVTRMQAAYIEEAEIVDLVTALRGGQPVNQRDVRARTDQERAPVGHIIDFVKRYQARRDGDDVTSDGRGGHNKKDPTEAMIAFALMRLIEEGDVSQRAVRDFSKAQHGVDCGSRRAQETIEIALERQKSKVAGAPAGQQSV